MVDAFDPEQWYKPERDGELHSYLERRVGLGLSPFPLFRGYEWFEILRRDGYLVSGNVIRLMRDMGMDEHFVVTPDYKLRGMKAGGHDGMAGIYEASVILNKDAPAW